MPDYIPATDGDFSAWENNFASYLTAHMADLGLTAPDIEPITSAQTAWGTAYTDNTAKQAAAEGATRVKVQKRQAYEGCIRALVRRLQASPTVTDVQRAALGITVKDGQPTPVGPSATQPAAIVHVVGTLRHEVRFVDAANPSKRAKPHGVIGCEIWVKIGDPAPVAESELTFLGMDTHSPYTAEYTMAEAGKMAHYRLRWVFTSGEKSAWSEIESLTIAA